MTLLTNKYLTILHSLKCSVILIILTLILILIMLVLNLHIWVTVMFKSMIKTLSVQRLFWKNEREKKKNNHRLVWANLSINAMSKQIWQLRIVNLRKINMELELKQIQLFHRINLLFKATLTPYRHYGNRNVSGIFIPAWKDILGSELNIYNIHEILKLFGFFIDAIIYLVSMTHTSL